MMLPNQILHLPKVYLIFLINRKNQKKTHPSKFKKLKKWWLENLQFMKSQQEKSF